MDNTTYVSLSHQSALRRKLDGVANNLANMNTHGYKAEQVMFREYLMPAGKETVSFGFDRGSFTDRRAGALEGTSNSLDVAIEGDAFLGVETPDGVRYTRDGRLKINDQGALVTSGGYPVLGPGGEPIAIPEGATSIVIAQDGTVSANDVQAGTIGLSSFQQPNQLIRGADGLYRTDEQPQPPAGARLRQGMVEASNVEPLREMVTMIDVTRQYQAAATMTERRDELERKAIDRLGRTG
jgi:flagellar basal-body rod protein FlgF